MAEAGEKVIEQVAEESAETVIELVEHMPLAYVLLAAIIGGALVFVVMMAISKPPTNE